MLLRKLQQYPNAVFNFLLVHTLPTIIVPIDCIFSCMKIVKKWIFKMYM